MFLTSALLTPLPHIAHGFFTRTGGVSEGIYASLNCGLGSGDSPAHVAENRARVAAKLNAKTLCTLYQVHGREVITLDANNANQWDTLRATQHADAMVTATPGIALGILTADCVPVLFADSKHPIIGAAHAGWKGAIGGVIEATLEAMETLGAAHKNIIATIGPAIGQTSYEIGPEFHARFIEETNDNARFFAPASITGHYYFDIKAYVKERLARAGIERVETLPHDTCADEAQFFSYRRTCLRGEKDYGRQVSAIMVKE